MAVADGHGPVARCEARRHVQKTTQGSIGGREGLALGPRRGEQHAGRGHVGAEAVAVHDKRLPRRTERARQPRPRGRAGDAGDGGGEGRRCELHGDGAGGGGPRHRHRQAPGAGGGMGDAEGTAQERLGGVRDGTRGSGPDTARARRERDRVAAGRGGVEAGADDRQRRGVDAVPGAHGAAEDGAGEGPRVDREAVGRRAGHREPQGPGPAGARRHRQRAHDAARRDLEEGALGRSAAAALKPQRNRGPVGAEIGADEGHGGPPGADGRCAAGPALHGLDERAVPRDSDLDSAGGGAIQDHEADGEVALRALGHVQVAVQGRAAVGPGGAGRGRALPGPQGLEGDGAVGGIEGGKVAAGEGEGVPVEAALGTAPGDAGHLRRRHGLDLRDTGRAPS